MNQAEKNRLKLEIELILQKEIGRMGLVYKASKRQIFAVIDKLVKVEQ